MFIDCTSTSELKIILNDEEREDVEIICRNLKVPPQAIFMCSLVDLPAYLDKLSEFAELSACQDLKDLY